MGDSWKKKTVTEKAAERPPRIVPGLVDSKYACEPRKAAGKKPGKETNM